MRFDLRTSVLTLLLVALLATAWFAWEHRHDLATLHEVQSLAAAAKIEAPICDAFEKGWKAFDTFTPAGTNSSTHKSKELALVILGAFETYPGWLPNDAALADYFSDEEAKLSRNMFFLPLLGIRAGIRGECGLLDFYRQAQLLLADIQAFH
ncbi:MAG: hypothetical protein ACXWR4_02865, partial [Bdellovibrionota bacterium]